MPALAFIFTFLVSYAILNNWLWWPVAGIIALVAAFAAGNWVSRHQR